MSGWMEIFKNARGRASGREPYGVKEMKFDDILDLQWLSNRMMKNRLKDENGESVKWLKIKCLRYSRDKPGIIEFRYDHHSEYNILNVCGRGVFDIPSEIKKAYHKILPISEQKNQDLWKLCTSNNIPEEYHGWYAQLPVSKNAASNDFNEDISEEE
jgi:hypothetical protein